MSSVNPEGEAGIHAAVKNADIDMILLLLDLGASIDRRDNLGDDCRPVIFPVLLSYSTVSYNGPVI